MSPQQPSGELIPAGDLMAEQISFEFAIFYVPEPTKDPFVELDWLLKEKFKSVRRVETIEEEVKSPVLTARPEMDPKSNYPLPDLEYLQYFGRGVSREQAEALQKTEVVLILDFAHSNDHVWDGLRSAVELTHVLATNTDGLIWDEATRELFSRDAWEQQRLADWTETVPDVSQHTTIHAYQHDERLRAITLGMEKMGLPDVVVDDFSWSLQRNMGHVINLFTQAIAEGAVVEKPGEFDLDVNAIKNPKVREPQVTSLKSNATGVAALALIQGTREEGDPLNRLIEITFDRGVGPDIYAKQNQILSAAFGAEDSLTYVEHDEAIQAASRRARMKLPALQAEFNKGLAPGEFILVKAPFSTPGGGQEWMWVEVNSWKDGKITGPLQNEPFNIPDLHAGQIVEISEADVFDYIRKHPDGTTEGNETARLIEERSQ